MMNFGKILSLPQKISRKIQYSRSIPSNHCVEDVFLVSYPKSGNTWLRFLIANGIKVHYQIEQEVNFFTILGIIPSPRGKTLLRSDGPFGRADIPRIIKSHSVYNPYYYRVILLVRDPRDVMVSYYNFLLYLNQLSPNIQISEFIRSKKFGIDNWLAHSESWYYKVNLSGQFIRIFRYEDFLKQTEEQLFLLMELLGIKMNDSELQQAVELSSIERMRESEKKHLSTHLLNKKGAFVRQASAKLGQDLPEQDRKYIEERTKNMAHLLGYIF